jgi:non-canonical (house-cleaning) NTP pyrophosphatase
VDSNVPQQPWGDDQTQAGAANRARASRGVAGAELGVGIEAGLMQLADGAVESVSWIVAVGTTGGDVVRALRAVIVN